MVKSTSNGTAKPANAESKVERSRLVLLGALAATAVTAVGCGGGGSSGRYLGDGD
ncbi:MULTISPECIES: hypothetical protein [Hoeflea]|jgi:hypothetical protein|uniref:Uncharacterized protein n=1 Tax=Hoeflea alexandrii TaxID=288436 RepID=A0ABT1CLT7_9HYPH|nr:MULTISPECIES: hypothetical protein [Hoeflea]MCO6407172.1 hypothetical protein [Hoeflea alexandrii]MCY0154404.1 hypothetical protein [Hoeflea alexandrii]